jgi:tRNA nucleotidyltransferase/poly(A) polymerase
MYAAKELKRAAIRCVLIGGAVRDMLLIDAQKNIDNLNPIYEASSEVNCRAS